jgi:hypothetical protein
MCNLISSLFIGFFLYILHVIVHQIADKTLKFNEQKGTKERKCDRAQVE